MGRISPGPTRWPPGAERRLVPAKSNLKPQTYLDWTKMYKDDRFFGPVYHKLRGDKPYDSEETIDFKNKGNKLFCQERILFLIV